MLFIKKILPSMWCTKIPRMCSSPTLVVFPASLRIQIQKHAILHRHTYCQSSNPNTTNTNNYNYYGKHHEQVPWGKKLHQVWPENEQIPNNNTNDCRIAAKLGFQRWQSVSALIMLIHSRTAMVARSLDLTWRQDLTRFISTIHLQG